MRSWLYSLAALGLLSCDDSASVAEQRAENLFSSKITEVVIEVDYAPGAEPYVGTETLFGADLWQLTHHNLEALFEVAPKTILLDDELDEMEEITPLDRGPDFTSDEILAIADRYRQSIDTAVSRSFYVVFLDGWLTEGGVRKTNVLGVSLGNTGVIAMFKPVIRDTGLTKRRIEQTTLIHELGHAFGLVDNGLSPVKASHHDSEHGAHCANPECIMYYQNEVGADLGAFIGSRVTDDDVVLFDRDCRDDAAAAAQ